MKKLLFLALLIGNGLVMQAQDFRFGLKGGFNYSDIKGKDLNDDMHRSKIGWHAGAMVNIQYPGNTWFSVQPELIYSRKGYTNYSPKQEVRDASNNLLYTALEGGLVRLNYLDLPIMLNFKTGVVIWELGPQISYLVGYRNDAMIEQTAPDGTKTTLSSEFRRFSEDRLRKFDVGLATGFRLETQNGVALGLRFNQGFLKLDNGEAAILTVPRAPNGVNQHFQVFASYLIPE
ncbi:porin family protein [Adhaeribacter soli]|uniref:PorT family protein n=1 Tax=Adhaeribacter soli TaxID=2607655 RepID=A0A5N1IIK8_9BACT|nr:porin family protein [Adhaeribacter soli]KAA9324976.1 PorT family protein [Adhaeribacter soli]